VLEESETVAEILAACEPSSHASISALRNYFVPAARSYFTLAAMTRRVQLEESLRSNGLSRLYSMRALIEKKVLQELRANSERLQVLKEATKPSFFGKSKKQGVGVRYALASCVPTNQCGGRCYAHDGRDRELLHIFRGVLNYFVGLVFENSDEAKRDQIIQLLDPAFNYAIKAANDDQSAAAVDGYVRAPRIRFSHVGEMTATPHFCNALAAEIKRRDPKVQCVIYTRHPRAGMLDCNLFVVNFTLDGAGDARARYAPPKARIVNSAWDGLLHEGAEVNFLEHHVEKIVDSTGSGPVCPVTVNHKHSPSCDLARCQRCFLPTWLQKQKISNSGPA
jgi:hypothetical protein